MGGTSSQDELRFSRLAEWLHAGDATAETFIVRRFTVQLVALARRHLARRIQQKSSPEDVVQSTFRSFFKRLRRGKFDFESWDGLWSLLVVITVRKCAGHHQKTVRNWCRRDVDRKEQDAIAGPLSAVIQVLPRNRRQAVFAEVMQGVCNLDSADLQRLSNLISKLSHADSDAEPEEDDEI